MERERTEEEFEVAIELLRLANLSGGTRELVDAAVAFFQRESDCEAVGIRLREGEDFPYYEARGFPGGFVREENSLCSRDADGAIERDAAGNPMLECMCGNVISGRFDASKPFFTVGGSFWTNSTTRLLASSTEADRQARTRNRCHGEGYESVALIPLRCGEERLGLLQLNDRREGRFTPEGIARWERLAGHLSVALSNCRVKEVLRQSEAQLRLFVEHAPAAVAMFDQAMRYMVVSRRWMESYGLGEQDLVGRSHYDVFPELPERWKAIHRRCLAGAVEKCEEDAFPRADGRVDWERWEIHPWRTGRGEIGGIIIFSELITERKESERALSAAKSAAEAASEAKDRFMATLSHELRTPLTPVAISVGILENDPGLPPHLREEIALIRRNLDLEMRLIDDLLDLNRVTRGKIDLHIHRVDLHEVLENVQAICRSDVEAKRLTLKLELGATERCVKGDSGRLQQIFWNLIKNAIKFTPEEGRIAVRTLNPRPGTVAVEVRDTGVGLEAQLIPRLFRAFEQGSREVTRQFGGMGLGLAISRSLVELHGGSIRVESAGAGQGATFIVELPKAAAGTETAGPAAPVRVAVDRARSARILLVEDHPDTLRQMSRLLTMMGHEVTTAVSVAEAVQVVTEREGAFDLLLSDVGLPDGSGLELMRELRERWTLKGIAVSGYGMEADIQHSREAGFAAHLTKPVQAAVLESAINEAMEGGDAGWVRRADPLPE